MKRPDFKIIVLGIKTCGEGLYLVGLPTCMQNWKWDRLFPFGGSSKITDIIKDVNPIELSQGQKHHFQAT